LDDFTRANGDEQTPSVGEDLLQMLESSLGLDLSMLRSGTAAQVVESLTDLDAPYWRGEKPDLSIKLDGFHVMKRYEDGLTCPRDPLSGVFIRNIANALYIMHPTHLEELKTWLRLERGMLNEDIERLPRSYFARRVPNWIPAPITLARRLSLVVETFEPLVTASGKSLFREKSEDSNRRSMLDTHSDVLRHALGGCISDPPNFPMFYTKERDRHVQKALRHTYFSKRGSSNNEVRVG